MTLENEISLIEAILYLEAEPLDVRQLARISGLAPDLVTSVLQEMTQRYQDPYHGIELVMIGESYGFAPKRDLWNVLKDRYGKKNDSRLSRSALETLSIIAYSQPVTRSEIENIRGVSADSMIKLLLTKNLVKEVGKKDVPGKPVQYGTTKDFLKMFRLSSLSDLPKMDETEQEKFELRDKQ